MLHTSLSPKATGFTLLESLAMLGLMTVLALTTLAIYKKESDPLRKGPGVWDRKDTEFAPAFHDGGERMDLPLGDEDADPLSDLVPGNKPGTEAGFNDE